MTIDPTHAGAAGVTGRRVRATAVPLRAGAFALLGRLDDLATAVLHGLPGIFPPEAEDRILVAAVVGTVLFEGLTTESPWRALAGVRRQDLDLHARVLVLTLSEPASVDPTAAPAADGRAHRAPVGAPPSPAPYQEQLELERRDPAGLAAGRTPQRGHGPHGEGPRVSVAETVRGTVRRPTSSGRGRRSAWRGVTGASRSRPPARRTGSQPVGPSGSLRT